MLFCYFDDFICKVEKNGDRKSLAKIYTVMNIASEGHRHKNIKPLQGFGEIEDFEIKVDHYRVYFFINNSRQLVVLGGDKKKQKRDIAKFREIKEDYLREIGE